MESYRELRDRQQKEFNELPLGFAFSDKQFDEMMEKWGLDPEKDLDKIYRVPGGGFIQKKDHEHFHEVLDRQQFENFCKNLYQTAYEEGRRSVPGIDITEVQKAISETPGIGAKRLEAIMESLNSKFAKEEDA